ncbi:alpha/beta fold hydrolase [Lysobacter capsici]|nr:alpha/beta hydrolase [Lysobacter capsici]
MNGFDQNELDKGGLDKNALDQSRRSLVTAIGLGAISAAAWANGDGRKPTTNNPSALEASTATTSVRYASQQVGEVSVFYRESGPSDAPVLLLLHGFPSASHMFRDLIPLLAQRYRVIAPDLPGFGNTLAPPRASFEYSFDRLAQVMAGFVDALELSRYALYVFDYGAPIGFRLAMKHPERIATIVSQNGNAYIEGLSQEWAPWQAYWRDPSAHNRDACRAALTDEAIHFQHAHGAPEHRLSPDGYQLDSFHMRRPEAQEIQLDLILSYRSNVALYPAFQNYFREYRPPLLAVWGKHDVFFIPPGAQAFKRDLPDADIDFLDAGHFAAETHYVEIARLMRDFLRRHRY